MRNLQHLETNLKKLDLVERKKSFHLRVEAGYYSGSRRIRHACHSSKARDCSELVLPLKASIWTKGYRWAEPFVPRRCPASKGAGKRGWMPQTDHCQSGSGAGGQKWALKKNGTVPKVQKDVMEQFKDRAPLRKLCSWTGLVPRYKPSGGKRGKKPSEFILNTNGQKWAMPKGDHVGSSFICASSLMNRGSSLRLSRLPSFSYHPRKVRPAW